MFAWLRTREAMGCPGVISRESHTGAIASEIVGEMGDLVMAAEMTPWIKRISSSLWTKIVSVLGHQCIRMALSQPGDCLLYRYSDIIGSISSGHEFKDLLLWMSESSISWFLVVVLSHNFWNQMKNQCSWRDMKDGRFCYRQIEEEEEWEDAEKYEQMSNSLIDSSVNEESMDESSPKRKECKWMSAMRKVRSTSDEPFVEWTHNRR